MLDGHKIHFADPVVLREGQDPNAQGSYTVKTPIIRQNLRGLLRALTSVLDAISQQILLSVTRLVIFSSKKPTLKILIFSVCLCV